MPRPVVLTVAVALVLTGCSDSGPHSGGARTYYESLDQSSPTAAVETFVDAFARDDFLTVWLSFGRQGQFGLQQDLNLLQYSRLVGPDAVGAIGNWMQNEFSFEIMESVDQWWFFDQIMLIADESDDFLIDLSGNVAIGIESITDRTATVSAEVAGIDGVVEFRLAQSVNGRWQINQVVIPGGDEDRVPWAVP